MAAASRTRSGATSRRRARSAQVRSAARLFVFETNSSPRLSLPVRDLAESEPQTAPSPPVGEGWGGGCLFDSADLIPPSRHRFAMATLGSGPEGRLSPTRGEVTGAS